MMTVQHFPDMKQVALQAFRRDLPQLWNSRPGQWVAYQGDQVLGFGSHKHELYQSCFQQGLKQDEFVIFCIEPELTEMTLSPMVFDE